METNPDFLSAEYWDERYREKETGWDIGYPSTPLKEYIDQLTNKNLRILIPGAGNGYEAIYLSQLGFRHITVIDISTVLTQQLTENISAHPGIKVLKGDFFELDGEFDLIVEQTFFCALHPSLRTKYVTKVKSLLSGNGKLVGLLFNRMFEINPPFGGNEEEYRQLFSSSFRTYYLEACYNSIPARSGSELFIMVSR